jgi:hypothetical protein
MFCFANYDTVCLFKDDALLFPTVVLKKRKCPHLQGGVFGEIRFLIDKRDSIRRADGNAGRISVAKLTLICLRGVAI